MEKILNEDKLRHIKDRLYDMKKLIDKMNKGLEEYDKLSKEHLQSLRKLGELI